MDSDSALKIKDPSIQKFSKTKTTDRPQTLEEKLVQEQTTNQEQPALQLPSDFLKTPSTSYQPEYYTFDFPKQLIETVKTGPSKSFELRSLLLAAFNALIYRYTQQETIGLQLTLADGGEDYTTQIDTQINGELKTQQLINNISTALASIQNQSEKLENQQQQDDRHDQQPNLPVAITFSKYTSDAEEQQWLARLQQKNAEASDSQDLHLIVLEKEQAVSAILNYNASLFRSSTIERLANHLQVLVEGMLGDLQSSVIDLPLLTQAEERQLLVEWKSESTAYSPTLIHQYVETYAIEQPDAIAVVFKDQKLTYAELNHQANQVAHYLNHAGVSAEVKVAVCIEPSLEIAVILLGIFKSGGIYLPLDPTHPVERIATILEETQPPVLLTQSHLLPNLPSTAQHTVCLDTDWETIHSFPTDNPDNKIALDQASHLVYTSGTTGKPKGVVTIHRNLINYILVAQERYGFNRQDIMPAIARFTFSITMFELLTPLAAGGTLIVLEREHVLDFNRMVQTLEQVTVLHTSPSLMQKLLVYIQDKGIDPQKFQGLRHASMGGDMVPAALLETMKGVFQNAEIFVIYGCSEISCMGCTFPVARDQKVTKSLVGKPFSNVAVRLYDPHQNLVPIGVPGEIYFGGDGVTRGYFQRDELTQEKFVTIDGQRFYRTGDLGRLHTDGNLEILGRSDFQIKLRGIRIELGEIEATLRQSPGVREGVVMARELGASEKSLVAYVVLDQTKNPSIEEIRRFLQTKLPDYMVPAGFVILEVMPVNINQKVDRRALPTPTPENLAGFKAFVAARNPLEQQLTEIWEAVLGISPIGIQDNFFEIGGHSLMALSLMTQIESVLGKTLPLSTLLTQPTIEQLAALMSQSGESDARSSLVLLRNGGSAPPIFFIHDGEGETLLYRNLAYCLKPEHAVYGIQPYSRDSYPILHTRVTDMASFYIEQIRKVQPEGPYLLGGLCVGGFLAFEMARQLQNQGQTVKMVALIDTADVEATLRTGLIADQRLSSLSKSLNQTEKTSLLQRLFHISKTVIKKAANLIAYETRTKVEKAQNKVKIKLFRYCLDKKLTVPTFLQNLPVRIVLKFAEREYIPQEPYQGEVVLFLATERSDVFDGTLIDDTPYAEIYSDPLLGWGSRTTEGVQLYKVPGGHSSMLQDSNAQAIAEKMQAYIDAAVTSNSRELIATT